MNTALTNSALNNIIPPEIKNDAFYSAIQRISQHESIKTVLEIGSSSGQGSTEAFVTGLRLNPYQPQLFCMEISKARFHALQERYATDSFVNCYNASSVSLEQFPSEQEVADFYKNTPTLLNRYPLSQVLSWLADDKAYLTNSGVSGNGIRQIKQEQGIEFFDIVLIDGSEFTGEAELNEVYGAKFILLDDIRTFKNYKAHERLLHDRNYILIEHNQTLRHGYSIFRKVDGLEELTVFRHEVAEYNLVKNLVKPGMVVFDVGANVGDYTLLFSQIAGNQGIVYAFEPTSSVFGKLQSRIEEKSCGNVKVFQNAVFSEDGFTEFNEFPEEYSVWNSIGKPQMLVPNSSTEYVPIAQSRTVTMISLDSFCQQQDVSRIDYLKIDVEGAESDVLQGAIALLKAKAIGFIQFEISQKMLEGLDRQAKDTFDILAKHGYECHRINPDGTVGEIASDSSSFYENYIAFPQLPIHFFTIVLNGEPFIRHHIDVFQQLSCPWHWHIIEGVADLNHDTAWSVSLGGKVTDTLHRNGLSKDGTTTYLDELCKRYPDQITIYRKPAGKFWDGKLEMVNAPLANIQTEALLWQVDVDELWTVEQIQKAHQLFSDHPDRTAAYYWCWYFVGEKLIISTRNCYAQNPNQEWLRTWRFKPGHIWAAHEPPVLVQPLPDGQFLDVGNANPFRHAETEHQGLVFQHFAYVTPEQLQFKEQYYGYTNALSTWQSLQKQTNFPIALRQYFPWVRDETLVDRVETFGIQPVAQRVEESWSFVANTAVPSDVEQRSLHILVDAVFFQIAPTGIARLWKTILEEWVVSGFAKHVTVLDRSGTAPRIPGIQYRTIPYYDYDKTESDRQLLQQVCDEEQASLFISTYYTTPINTPSIFMAYDMIPEVVNTDLTQPMWREKHNGIRHACRYIAISESTARDLVKFFPTISPSAVTVAHCGVDSTFVPQTEDTVAEFRAKYNIAKPYFLLVGSRRGYKNALLFFQAFAQLRNRAEFSVVCVSHHPVLEDEFQPYVAGAEIHTITLSDEELRVAYAGAVSLVYPSWYEGFGLPIAEAMACGCPVITCNVSSIPEVAGNSALYVRSDDPVELTAALMQIQQSIIREQLIEKGFEQVRKFSWTKMAEIISTTLVDESLCQNLRLRQINLVACPDWEKQEDQLLKVLTDLVRCVMTHDERQQISLLLDASTVDLELANMALSSVCMYLVEEMDADFLESTPEFILLDKSSWENLSLISNQLSAQVELPGMATINPSLPIPVVRLEDLQTQELPKIILEKTTWFSESADSKSGGTSAIGQRIKYSYLDEESIIEKYITAMPIEHQYCVDIAASDGITMSNTYFLYKQGWSGLAVEYDSRKFASLSARYQEFPGVNLSRCMVTPENVIALLEGNHTPKKFGILNLDIDGYDYFVMDELLKVFRPSLICAEINENIPPPIKFTVKWHPNYSWNEDCFFGQSLSQIHLLCEKYNYSLVEVHYNNAFLIPNELSPVPSMTPEEAHRKGYLEKPDRQQKFPWNAKLEEIHRMSPEEALSFLKHQLFEQYTGQFECYI
jgi:FkbM family methyltransferase